MNHRARHAKPSASARAYARGAAVLGVAAVAAGAGVIGTVAPAGATPAPLSVTLGASSDGASATWDASGEPVLTLGSDSSSTYAQVEVNLNASTGDVAPSIPPTFATDNYAAGSPRWVIELANGNWITGYPAQLGGGATADFTGNNWAAENQGGYTTYQKALAAANDALGNVKVTNAYIVADGDQAAGVKDTLTAVQYNGESLPDTTTATGYIKNVHSGKCLDVTGGNYGADAALQQWTCGAKSPSGVAGGDQQFKYTVFGDGTGYLEAMDGTTAHFVAAGAKGSDIAVFATPSSADAFKKSGPYYEFPNDNGMVMDVKGASTANGGTVDAWPLNDGTNQQWSLP